MSPHKSRMALSRRDALCRIGNGFGMMAFAGMVSDSLAKAGVESDAEGAIEPRKLDFAPRAKRVIFLYMNGGLSQVDSFDPKPALEKYHGKPLPGGSVATERKTGTLMKSPFQFKKYGKSGIEVSELFPARRRVRGRHLLHPLGVHRYPESRAVHADDEHRPQPGGAAVHGVVADLRIRNR